MILLGAVVNGAAIAGGGLVGLFAGKFLPDRLQKTLMCALALVVIGIAVPGIGAFFVTSVQSLDYTMTLGLTVFFGVFVVAANFIIDLIYGLVDPRIRIAK